MIEISRVEPKKIQRKLLMEEQKKAICHKTDSMLTSACSECPMAVEIFGMIFCWKDLKKLQSFIEDYWNAEVDIDL